MSHRLAITAVAVAGLAAGAIGLPAPASAQTCQELGKIIQARQALVARIQGMSKGGKKMEAKAACSVFGQLASNGVAALKFIEVNKDWCGIPDAFVTNFKTDHAKAVDLRGHLAGAAQGEAERRAKAGGPNAGPFGGPGLTGELKVPQGAL
jgi:hypothetical protein